MADMTSLQAASVIERTVNEIMTRVVVPDIERRVQALTEDMVVRAVQHLIGHDIERYARDVVREQLAGRIEVSVTVSS